MTDDGYAVSRNRIGLVVYNRLRQNVQNRNKFCLGFVNRSRRSCPEKDSAGFGAPGTQVAASDDDDDSVASATGVVAASTSFGGHRVRRRGADHTRRHVRHKQRRRIQRQWRRHRGTCRQRPPHVETRSGFYGHTPTKRFQALPVISTQHRLQFPRGGKSCHYCGGIRRPTNC